MKSRCYCNNSSHHVFLVDKGVATIFYTSNCTAGQKISNGWLRRVGTSDRTGGEIHRSALDRTAWHEKLVSLSDQSDIRVQR